MTLSKLYFWIFQRMDSLIRGGFRRFRAARLKTQATLSLAIFLFTGLVAQGVAALMPPPMPLVYAYVPSPFFDNRPLGSPINCVTLHATVEPTTEGTMNIFLTSPRKVSAHFVVGKDGRVVQMVPVEKRAWHAGVSELEGEKSVNNFSVGIEMVNLNNGTDPYPEEQMEAVAGIIRFLRSRYDIPDSRIVSHASIALPAGRKNDPAGFDFEKIKLLTHENWKGMTENALDKTTDPPL